MKRAFLFPGQGSQYVGMGKDLYDAFPEVRQLYSRAADILGFDLAHLSFEGPAGELTRTENAQPAIFTMSAAIASQLTRVSPEIAMTAGHSLGEYSALACSGALTFDDGLRLVRKRGLIMANAGSFAPGAMAAVIGLGPDAVAELCRRSSEAGNIYPANYNAPGQIVISGSAAGIARAEELAPELGARRVIPLDVNGAFHSPYMAAAAEELQVCLDPVRDAGIPVIANCSASEVLSAGAIRQALLRQMDGPVRWEESMRFAIAAGVNRFVEVGPGKVLAGLLKRIDKSVDIVSTSDIEGLAGALDFLKAGG